MIPRHCGPLAVGDSVAEAFNCMWHLEQLGRVQFAARNGGARPAIPPDAAAERVRARFGSASADLARPVWQAPCRDPGHERAGRRA